MIPLVWYLILSFMLFIIGVIGVLVRRNAIVIFMSIELMLNAANLAFVSFSKFLGDMGGHLFVLISIVVAAAEVAVGLAIIISIFRLKRSINIDEVNLLKW